MSFKETIKAKERNRERTLKSISANILPLNTNYAIFL